MKKKHSIYKYHFIFDKTVKSQVLKKSFKTYVLLSDGECNEGTVWEAALFAPNKNLSGLCGIIDYNKWQATGRSNEMMSIYPLKEKFVKFGWNAIEIDGHNHKEIFEAINNFLNQKDKPSIIVANTIKGKGVSFMENDNNWHYRIPNKEEVILAKKELGIY